MATTNKQQSWARQQRATQDNVRRLSTVRTLWSCYFNSEVDIKRWSEEFYYAVGDVLEGTPPKDLKIQQINKEAFLNELKNYGI